jgi:hypothetical protein
MDGILIKKYDKNEWKTVGVKKVCKQTDGSQKKARHLHSNILVQTQPRREDFQSCHFHSLNHSRNNLQATIDNSIVLSIPVPKALHSLGIGSLTI